MLRRTVLPLCRFSRQNSPLLLHKGDTISIQRQWISRSWPILRAHGSSQAIRRPTLDDFKRHSILPRASCTLRDLVLHHAQWLDKAIIVHGYLGTRRKASKGLTFAELSGIDMADILQIVEARNPSDASPLRALQDHVPVVVHGVLQRRTGGRNSPTSRIIPGLELKLEKIQALNSFDQQVTMTDETIFPPEQRHLQIRNDAALRRAIEFRSDATSIIRHELCTVQEFKEIETPLLFKSTPEGAREFLVPTRSPGMAYALPQSPQQYKQILMASTIPRYMQIARCFRDEDLRADRQPEFTQVDLEMAFASSDDVINTIERLVHRLWTELLPESQISVPFQRLSYQEAMSRYGSDKPDPRFDSIIHRVEDSLPTDLISKISDLQDPIVEAFKLTVSDNGRETSSFIRKFMESSAAAPFLVNPAGQPGIFIIDSTKPLSGLQPLGFDAADQLTSMLDLQDGDCLIAQAREKKDFVGGHTMIGNLRLALHAFAVKQEHVSPPTGFSFAWINDFPLFSPSTIDEPGQGGTAGLSATHHPFTAPKSAVDIDLLLTDPLQVKADHYDLVVNGVELGGGSRRIHDAAMQEFVMREVLKMDHSRIQDFAHLLNALKAGCPPHAGIALGLDRLIAVMLGRDSVRDVIAFPKSGKGEDLLVKSPSGMTKEQLATYHLRPATSA